MSYKQRLIWAIPTVLLGGLLASIVTSFDDPDAVWTVLQIGLAVLAVGALVTKYLLTRRVRNAMNDVERLMPDYGGARFTSRGLAQLWTQLDILLDPAEPAPEMKPGEDFIVTLTPKLLCFLREGTGRRDRGELLLMLPADYIVAIEPSESTVETSGTTGPAVSIAFLGSGLRGVLTLAVPSPRDLDALVDELRGYLTTAR